MPPQGGVITLFEDVGRTHGRLDILFLNAGIAKFAPLTDSSDAMFDETIQVNLKGPFAALRAALPLLRNGASVIFNTTAATERGLATASVYSASKPRWLRSRWSRPSSWRPGAYASTA